MQYDRLQAAIARGLGVAARQLGVPYDLFRPAGAGDPLAAANRVTSLPACFANEDGSFHHLPSYGRAGWCGLFDTRLTRAGDYLAGPDRVYFIATQSALLPTLCILTNRTVSIARAASPAVAGTNPYGGITAATAMPILSGWPASVLSAGSGTAGDLPGDGGAGSWTILLPATPVDLRPADLVHDDRGQAYVAGSVELTMLGWRIVAKQATS